MTVRCLFLSALFLVPSLLSAQVLKVASYNVERLGEQHKDYAALAKVIANFDVVAAEEVMSSGGLEKVMSILSDGWEAAMSENDQRPGKYREFFGFFYNESVELYKMLGAYPPQGVFSRPPFGANFKVKGSPFSFNLVACHIDSSKVGRARDLELDGLGDVYRHFEQLTGNRGITILVGDFGSARIRDFHSLTALGGQEVMPQKAPDSAHIFVSAALRPRIQKADVLYWTRDLDASRGSVSSHFPVYMVLKAGR